VLIVLLNGKGRDLMNVVKAIEALLHLCISRGLLILSQDHQVLSLFTRPSRFFLLDLPLICHNKEACDRPVIAKSDELDNLSTSKKDHARQLSNDLHLIVKTDGMPMIVMTGRRCQGCRHESAGSTVDDRK
jgi:hypothetical protein